MLKISEQYVYGQIISAGGFVEITDCITRIEEYKIGHYYESKNIRLAQWKPDDNELCDLIISIFTAVLVHEKLTYQAIVGMLNHKIPMDDLIDRVKTIAEVVAIISKSGLIKINRRGSGKYIMITTDYTLNEEIPCVDKHGLTINRPQPVESNFDENQGSMILGSSLNFHKGNLCLDHINRMNKIPFKLNKEFFKLYEETPKHTLDTIEKQQQWDTFVKDSSKKYLELIGSDNRCYLNHKYCTRGRTYAVGYHINTQGSSYKKAIIQLANKEYLNKE